MKKFFYFAAVCAVLSGCAGPAARIQATLSRRSAVVHATRTYVLGKIPDQDRERSFQELLDSAQAQAEKEHAGDKSAGMGFSYSLTPKGAVYAFSEVEVSCLLQASRAAGRGKELCAEFFRVIDSRIKNIAAPR